MLAQIHLSRKFKVDANFFELYDPSPSSLKKLLLELEKSPRAYDLDVELYRLLKQAVTDDKFMKGIWDRSTKKPEQPNAKRN
ncbi:hypothetical protein CCR75_006964 [Bremia lactucae]|uniref:Uncharacterized protein n=1 Tax=Bremia lactucae TaxID=4779 RepID=A0A976FM05_BRELC|nr:hypothetical protein CCR75_006964 [Bremia lactucae]